MQNIVIAKPYRFVRPYSGLTWVKIFQYYLSHYLRRNYGITEFELRSTERLRESLAAGHGIVLAPNHCRPCDPMVMGQLSIHLNKAFYIMASWHLFKASRFQGWLIRRLGGFSVYREGLDREAIRTAINILVAADRPLVMLPEGIVTRANDRLGPLQEGVSFIATTAARIRARAAPESKVVVHPIALKYFFEGNLEASVRPVLEALGKRLGWRSQTELPLRARIGRLGEALLSLKEIEYLGKAQPGAHAARLASLIEHLLVPLEKEWLSGQREPSVVERVKQVRSAIVPGLAAGTLPDEERSRRWRQLADLYLAQQLWCYPPNYLCEPVTPERLLETVERFEEDVTDVARSHPPLRVVMEVGPALPVSPVRTKGGADPLINELRQQLTDMIQNLDRTARRPGG